MPRFLAARTDARLLRLPWDLPLVDWPTSHLVALPRGISRHVVRFIQVGDQVFAAKEILEAAAVHEYRQLAELKRLNIPAVEAAGVVLARRTSAGEPLDPILLTKHLPFSLPYRSLFHSGVKANTVNRLIDALVALLARLHLSGYFWGDVSLSNVLFRRDADEFAAYLVDAETGEFHDQLTDGQRAHDLQIATVNLFGEFNDLETGGLLDESLEPQRLVETIEQRYHALWHELTGVEEFSGTEMSRLEGRVRRLNAMGFDVSEIDIHTSSDGRTIRIQPKVVEAGHHSRRLMRLTGLDTEEHQARRLLNDMDYFRAKLPGSPSESVAAHKWLLEVFEPAISRIPPHLDAKRDRPQFFHEVLDYRWFQSQREQREVSTTDAAEGYVNDVLTALPDEIMGGEVARDSGRELHNKYDPSQGFADEGYEAPYDPWEDAANDPDLPLHDRLDIDSLRRQAANRPKPS
ncbi:MAG: lipopolysaccharide kinase [Arachnia propionica]|nr:MAG: lipopolysaccharide kinase [Arachnia propionica]